MQPLRYAINLTLDGCTDHRAGLPDAELHAHAAEGIANADVLLFGRITYEMMEEAWRPVAETGVRPDWMDEWMVPFAATIHAARKVVVSRTLPSVDWNAELVQGDLATAVRALKAQPGRGILTGGVTLPLALAELGLIDEVEVVVHPRIEGHGPALFAGLSRPMDLELLEQRSMRSGKVVLRYAVRPSS